MSKNLRILRRSIRRKIKIKIKIREQEGLICEMMILITEEDSFLGLSLVGKISLDQLSSVAKTIDIEDFMGMSN